MKHYIQLLRPHHWVKNVVVFAGPALGLVLFTAEGFSRTLVCFAAFCLASSSIYAINDAMDYRADALHPGKRTRPVASGAISPLAAWIVGGLLIVLAAALSALLLPRAATLLVAVYFVMMLGYSLGLKRRMILDVIIIAIGFVIRAAAGAEAVAVAISPWLVICTFMICMFLGFGKRRCELAAFANVEEAREHRPTLLRYTPELLNHLISVTAGIAIITFVQYTMDDNPARMPPFPKEHLLYTLPLVAYGVFRYAMLIESGRLHGPTEILLHDRPFLATVVAWAAIAAFVVYERRILAMIGWGG